MQWSNPLRVYRETCIPPMRQVDLARLIGVSKATLSRWESGHRRVDRRLVPKIVTLTGIQARYLRPDLAAIFGPPSHIDPPFAVPPDAV